MNFSYLHGARILVTGGTGFVGRHLLPELLHAGAIVTCLTRETSSTSHLPQAVRVVRADLCTGNGLAAALTGQDMVIHMAALLFGLGWQDYLRANTRAATVLAQATAAVPSIGRVLLVSSLAATGPSDHSPGVCDNDTPAPVSAYGWSKFMSEQIFARYLGEKLIVVRPPIIYGSGDRGLLPCFRAAQRGLLVSPGTGRPFPVSAVHAKDMVQAVMLCLQEAAYGVYHINDGQEYTMQEFSAAIGTAVGRKARVLGIPLPIMAVAALGTSLLGQLKLCGRRAPSWNMDKYREAKQKGWLCTAARIRAELGYSPTMSLQAGMAEAVQGYRKEGWL